MAKKEKPTEEVRPGVYRHFKLKTEYLVLGLGENTEDKWQHFVAYRRLADQGSTLFWLRPAHMFSEMVENPELRGHQVPRFVFVREATVQDLLSLPMASNAVEKIGKRLFNEFFS